MQTPTRICQHYLRLELRTSAQYETPSLWAHCRNCRRGWFLGTNAKILAGAAPITHTDAETAGVGA